MFHEFLLFVPLKYFRDDGQNHGRESHDARHGIEEFPPKGDHEKQSRTERDQQQAQVASNPLRLPGTDLVGELLKNEKAENNDGRADCQGKAGLPSNDESPRG